MGKVYSTVTLLSAKRALQRPYAASVAVICAHGFFVCQYLIEILPTIIYWLIVASAHSTDNHGYSLFHSNAVIGKASAPKAICCVRGRQLRPWLLCLPILNRNNDNNHLLAYSSLPLSTDIHGYSLFHSKAVIGKESAPKAFRGVIGRLLRPWLLCLPIFNRNNANNHLLAYSSLPPLHGKSWVQFIPQ